MRFLFNLCREVIYLFNKYNIMNRLLLYPLMSNSHVIQSHSEGLRCINIKTWYNTCDNDPWVDCHPLIEASSGVMSFVMNVCVNKNEWKLRLRIPYKKNWHYQNPSALTLNEKRRHKLELLHRLLCLVINWIEIQYVLQPPW